MPRVHTIAAGAPFLDVLARGLIARAGGDPLALARATVLLPTRRAARALAAALLRESGGDAALAPRALALADLDDDDAWAETDPAARDGVPPAIAPLERLVRLADLVRARPEIGGDPAAAARLAASLAALLDSAALENASLAKLDAVVPGELASHWQRSLEALEAARARWPAELARLGRVEPAERQVRLLRARAARWRASPPTGLVVAAGSTGSVPATAELLAVVAGLPDGHVVLPGLDRGLDAASWEAAAEDPCHPQHALARLLATLGVERAAVGDWVSGVDPSPRAALLAEALRPAARTDAWRGAAPASDASLAGLARVEADGPDAEAGAVALALREALETPARTAALVTPDRALARRVAAELARWGIEVDDSAGVPLARTPPASLLRLALRAAGGGAAVDLLATLKHPLARAGLPRGELLRLARRLERRILRRAPAPAGLAAILAAAGGDAGLAAFAGRLAAALAPLRDALARQALAPRAALAAQVGFAEWLATGPDSPDAAGLWSGEAGEAAARVVRELDAALAAMAPIAGSAWPALFDALIAGTPVRPRAPRHSRLAIWGPLEARLQAADLVVLGGLNEGTWPPAAPEDPWLSREMRRALGLPPPERRVGLSAQDFVMAAAAPAVLLTRSRKVDGAPTRPARWLQRLDALLDGDPRWARTRDESPWRAWQAALDRPEKIEPLDPPEPRPPVAARPRRLRVTQVETWIRDPYAIWAREILGLETLEPLDPEPAGADRGSAVHEALKLFHEATRDGWPAQPVETLLECGRRAFAPLLARPAVRAIWWPRFRRMAAWLAAWEEERRASGAVPLAAERRGAWKPIRPGGEFLLHGRADRIDRLPGGALAILDWKTGGVPSDREMASGLAPQLALEAVIAAEHGFEGGLGGAVAELVHVRLTGGEPGGEACAYEPPDKRPEMTVEALIVATRANFERLVDQYDRVETAYLSRPRPKFVDYEGEYDHLARVREWSAALGEEP